MSNAPKWYRPLTLDQREQLASLVEQATGIRPKLPPPGAANDSPAGFLCELERGGHVSRMESLASQFQRRREPFYYDPKTGGLHDAKTHAKFT